MPQALTVTFRGLTSTSTVTRDDAGRVRVESETDRVAAGLIERRLADVLWQLPDASGVASLALDALAPLDADARVASAGGNVAGRPRTDEVEVNT